MCERSQREITTVVRLIYKPEGQKSSVLPRHPKETHRLPRQTAAHGVSSRPNQGTTSSDHTFRAFGKITVAIGKSPEAHSHAHLCPVWLYAVAWPDQEAERSVWLRGGILTYLFISCLSSTQTDIKAMGGTSSETLV